MDVLFDDGPIIACSTSSASNAAIGVVRISGFVDLLQLSPFFSTSLDQISPGKVFYSQIRYEEKIYDEVLGLFFQGPRSYNGENILELSVHGNRLNIENILSLFVTHGNLRLAHPGEFTYRALKNGKLSLFQVEGLDLMLNATSPLMLEQGHNLLLGQLHAKYGELYQSFLKLKAAVEISIDFLEDVGEEVAGNYFHQGLTEVSRIVQELFQRTQGPSAPLMTPEVLLVGQTNAGKSSLFNRLLGKNRSIVSEQAGTTRDYISETLVIEGTPFRLIDTAGLRETSSAVELEGILRMQELFPLAFFKILVVNPFAIESESWQHFAEQYFDLVIFTHRDQEGFAEKKRVLPPLKLTEREMEVSLMATGPIGPVGPGLEGSHFTGPIGPASLLRHELMGADIVNLISTKYHLLTKDGPILLERHRELIRKMNKQVSVLRDGRDQGQEDMGVLSYEVNILGHSIEELLGVVTPNEVLSSIFNTFCIGK